MMSVPVMLPADTHLGMVHLRVRSLAASLDFYADALGLFEIARRGDVSDLSADGEHVHVRLTAVPDAAPRPGRSTGLYHLAVRLPSRPALGALFRRLALRQVPFQGFSDHLVSEALYLPDPDGLGVELYRDRPRREWPMSPEGVQMATEPLNIESLLEDADPARWAGIPPGTDIGHVHLHVRDLAVAEAFYRDVIGFDVTQRGYPGALFMAAGGYHHHLGLNVWAGGARPPQDAVGLLGYEVVIPDDAAFAGAAQRALAAGGQSLSPGAVAVRDADDVRVVVTRSQARPSS